jgi:hypothetical protein
MRGGGAGGHVRGGGGGDALRASHLRTRQARWGPATLHAGVARGVPALSPPFGLVSFASRWHCSLTSLFTRRRTMVSASPSSLPPSAPAKAPSACPYLLLLSHKTAAPRPLAFASTPTRCPLVGVCAVATQQSSAKFDGTRIRNTKMTKRSGRTTTMMWWTWTPWRTGHATEGRMGPLLRAIFLGRA